MTGAVYDAAGKLYLADAANHVVRSVDTAGVVRTVAGTGVAGFGGDGGAATSAYLDTPTGVAVDASGNVYVADSHNHRIRRVSAAGVITTVAGTGLMSFGGDGGLAVNAQLALPSAVVVDANGYMYIADTNNNRVRQVSASGVMATLAGGTEQFNSGDGGPAAAAFLNHPTGVAVDAAGNVYIADRENHSVRVVNASSKTISTLVGAGTPASFAGMFSGDYGASAAAGLAKPTGVWVDAAGNVYVADTNNQRVRQISGGVIGTVVGTGDQGNGGDGGPATAAMLNGPRIAAPDLAGNLAIADTLNQEVRAALLGVLPAYPVQAPGTVSATTEAVTLTNAGNAALAVQAPVLVAAALAQGGSCGAFPLTLAPGTGCTQNVAFAPGSLASIAGSVSFGGAGIVTQKVLLSGTTDAVTVQVASVQITLGTPTTPLQATVAFAHSQGSTPSGAIAFSVDGGAAIAGTCTGTGVLTCNASAGTGALALGAHKITAMFGIAMSTGTLQVQQTPGTIPVCTLGAAQGTAATMNGATSAASTFTLSVPAGCAGTAGHTITTTIDWGDKTAVQPVSASPATHSYLASGTYNIVLTGVDTTVGLTMQLVGSAMQSVAVVLPPTPMVSAGTGTAASTVVIPQVAPTPTVTVTFLCTSVAVLSATAAPTVTLPSVYGISCTPFTTTVSSTAATPVTIQIQTTAGSGVAISHASTTGLRLALGMPLFGMLFVGGGFLLPRNRRRYARWMQASGSLLTVCCLLSSCGGSFTPPPVIATPAGTYYLTVNEVVNGTPPTGFVQTSLIVPLTIQH